jgi:hypothetical protein
MRLRKRRQNDKISNERSLLKNKKKLIGWILLTVLIILSLSYGIILGDPLDMRVEASGL